MFMFMFIDFTMNLCMIIALKNEDIYLEFAEKN